MMSMPRQIAAAVLALVLALLAVGIVFWLMLGEQVVSLNTQLPTQAMTAPMIGVVVFWMVGRALRVPLDPVRTFLYGALVVYGTLYFFGRIIAMALIAPGVALPVALLVIVGFAILAVHRAVGQVA